MARQPERRTPLSDLHLRSAGQMVRGGGDYMLPLAYTSPVEEHVNTRTHVGLQDLSSMGQVDVKGPGAERLVNRLLVNDVRDVRQGKFFEVELEGDDRAAAEARVAEMAATLLANPVIESYRVEVL